MKDMKGGEFGNWGLRYIVLVESEGSRTSELSLTALLVKCATGAPIIPINSVFGWVAGHRKFLEGAKRGVRYIREFSGGWDFLGKP
jgi:hypothetical protein